MFSSYVDYRPKTTAVILLDMGHTLRVACTGEEYGKGRKPKTTIHTQKFYQLSMPVKNVTLIVHKMSWNSRTKLNFTQSFKQISQKYVHN
jgi:hypothetical protein